MKTLRSLFSFAANLGTPREWLTDLIWLSVFAAIFIGLLIIS